MISFKSEPTTQISQERKRFSANYNESYWNEVTMEQVVDISMFWPVCLIIVYKITYVYCNCQLSVLKADVGITQVGTEPKTDSNSNRLVIKT